MANAATRYVGTCGTPNTATVQAAVGAASDGDTILVCPGTYSEAVNVTRNGLTIKGSTGNAADVKVNATGAGNAVFALNAASLTLKDMTLSNPDGFGFYAGSGSAGPHVFENLVMSAGSYGFFLEGASNAASFKSVAVTVSTQMAIFFGWNASGAHVLEGVTAIGGTWGIYADRGLASLKNVNATAGTQTAISIGNKFATTFDTVTAAAANGYRGILINNNDASSNPAYTFTNVKATAKDVAISVGRSGKVTMNSVTATSSTQSGISFDWNADGAHVFDTVTATGASGISLQRGAASLKNITAKGTTGSAIGMGNKYGAAFDTVTATSDSHRGIEIANSDGVSNGYSFTNVKVTANSRGINIARSGKVVMNGITVNTPDHGLWFEWDADGAHELSNLDITAGKSGISVSQGLAKVEDFKITANTDAGIAISSIKYDATIRRGTISAPGLMGIYITGTSKNVTVQDVTVTTGWSYGIQLMTSSQALIQRVCVSGMTNSGIYTEWNANNVTIRDSQFGNSGSYGGVFIGSNPAYPATVTNNAFLKTSLWRAWSQSNKHVFNGNYWQGVAGGTNYLDGNNNINDKSTLASNPVTACWSSTPPPNPLLVDDDKVQCPTAAYTKIQDAVNAAKDGDTITVCPGTYAENVDTKGKTLALQSSTGNKADVTIKPTATAGITTTNPMTVRNLTITSTTAGVHGVSACPASPATLAMSGVAINVNGGNAIYQNTSGNGCQGLALDLTDVTAIVTAANGSGILLNNGAGAHKLVNVSATGTDSGWSKSWGIHINGGASFTATNLDVVDSGTSSMTGSSAAALWLQGISGNASITATDGKAHSISATSGNWNYGVYFCPSSDATLTLAGAGAGASALTTVGGRGAAIYQNTSGTCPGKVTLNLSNLDVNSWGGNGIDIQNGGGAHALNFLTLTGQKPLFLNGGAGAMLTDVDFVGNNDSLYEYLVYLEAMTGGVTFNTANKSRTSVGMDNASKRRGGILFSAAAGSTIPVSLSNVSVDVTETSITSRGGGGYGKYTVNATNVATGVRASSGILFGNGAGNHVVNNATLYGRNGYGWPLRLDGGADITLTDVDAYQLGTSSSGYPAVSLNAFTGNLTVSAPTKTGNRCVGNFNASGTGTANSYPGACIMNLDAAGGTVSTNGSSNPATGLSVCNAVGATSLVNISGIYAQGSGSGISLAGGGSCGKYTASLSNVTAEVTAAYFGPTIRNPDSMNNHGWARPISIGNGTGAHLLTNVTAIGTYAYSGISINGGGATLTDVVSTGLVAAIDISATGAVTVSNPAWAAANPYPATNPANFPIRGVSWPNGINGSGMSMKLTTAGATAFTFQNTAIGGAGSGIALNTVNGYEYPNAKLVMSNVSVNAAGGDGVVLGYGTGQAHSISNVTVTATRTAMNLSRGTNAALSNLDLTCGSDGATAATGLVLDYQSGTVVSGTNTIACKSPGSTGMEVGGGNGGCSACSISGATVDMTSQSNSVGIWARYGSSNTTISGNYVKNANREGVLVWEYPVTVTNNVVENSGQASGYYGINMTRGAGIAYNNCVYTAGRDFTTQTSLCAGASPCNSSYPLIDPKPSATATMQGNFWGSWPKGTGYSDTCADGDSDGLCDGGNYGGDKAPLKKCRLSSPGSATLVAHYKFDDTWSSTDTLEDSSGNNKHATLTGTVAQEPASAAGIKPNTCKAGNVNKAGYFTTASGLDVDTAADKKNSVSFWMYWDGGFSSSNFTMPFSWSGVYYDLTVSKYRSEMGNGVIGFNTGNGDVFGVSADGLANGWHHVAAVFNNGDATKSKLYIDGVAKTLTSYGGQYQRSVTTTAGIGAGAGWGGDYKWSGKLDQMKIYKGEMSATQVAADMAEATPCATELVAQYRMDELGWNGTAGEVKDTAGSSGGPFNGTAIGMPLPATDYRVPARAGTTGTCGYGSFTSGTGGSAIDITGLPVSTAAGAKTTVSFWMYWTGTSSVMPIGWRGYDLYFAGSAFGFNTSQGDIYGITSSGLANAWHHVVAVFNNGDVTKNKLYIDGVAQTLTQQFGSPSVSYAVVQSNLHISGWTIDDRYRFSGLIDEVKVFNGEASATQAADLYAETHACPARPLAEYRMDEAAWSGAAGEVANSGGSYPGGRAVNGATTTVAGKICNAGSFSGSNQYVQIDTPVNLSDFSYSAWVNDGGSSGWRSIIDVDNDRQLLAKYGGSYAIYGRCGNITITTGSAGWHHLVWTVSGSNYTVYVDGVAAKSGSGCGASVTGSHLMIGAGYGGNEYWNGQIDEAILFNGALSASEVAAIYANQNAGKNWDGSTRSCPAVVAEYHFEEATAWNGAAGEVKDTAGYGGGPFNGRAIGSSLPTQDKASPARSGDPGTCGYANLGGPADGGAAFEFSGLPVSTAFGAKTTVAFWMYWDGAGGVMPIGWNAHDIYITGSNFGFNTFGGDIWGTSSSGLANSWHHIVAVFTNGDVGNNEIYIDGVKQTLSLRQGTVNNGNAYVQPTLRVGGTTYNTGYRFTGRIDELKVLNGPVTQAVVTALYNETHPCGLPVAEWRMDEPAWNGTTGEVKDNAGSNHATAKNYNGNLGLPTTDNAKICRGGRFKGDWNETPTQGHANYYLEAPDADALSPLVFGKAMTLTGWFKTASASPDIPYPGDEQAILYKGEGWNIEYYVYKSSGHARARIYGYSQFGGTWDDIDLGAISADRWYFFAVSAKASADGKTITTEGHLFDASGRIGGMVTSTKAHVGAIGSLPHPGRFYIGMLQNPGGGMGNPFSGWIDEIKVFSKALSRSEIEAGWANEAAGKNWDGTPRGECAGGASAPAANFNVVDSYYVQGSYDTATTHNLYTKLAGWDETANSGNGGKDNTTFKVDVIALDGAGKTQTTYVASSQTKDVKLEIIDDATSTSCNSSPSACSNCSKPVIATVNPVKFASSDAGYKNDITVKLSNTNAYKRLIARVTDINSTPPVYGCSTNAFSVRPRTFTVTAATSGGTAMIPSSNGATGKTTVPAGTSFTLNADSGAPNYDGTPRVDTSKVSDFLGSTTATATLFSGNFNQAGASNGQANGSFTYGEVGYVVLGMDAVYDATYVNSSAQDIDDGDCVNGSTSNIKSAAGLYGCNVGSAGTSWGRFIPHHFDVTVANTGAMQKACNNFTYTGQPMGYETVPLLTIKAMNANGGVTQNYKCVKADGTPTDNCTTYPAGAFQKLKAADVSITASTADATQNGKDGATKTALAATLNAGTLTNSSGTMTYTLGGDSFTYTRNANSLIGLYTSAIRLPVASVLDSDGVAALQITDATPSPCLPASPPTTPSSCLMLAPTGVEIRYGRARLTNAYGSELLDLQLPFRTEYWNGSTWLFNNADTCTGNGIDGNAVSVSIAQAGSTNITSKTCVLDSGTTNHSGAGCAAAAPVTKRFTKGGVAPCGGANQPVCFAGDFNLWLQAPGNGNAGAVDATATVPSWLQFNWQGSTVGNPTARAKFGSPKANYIYMRERY